MVWCGVTPCINLVVGTESHSPRQLHHDTIHPSIHPSLFLLFLALKSCVSLALSKGGYFHPASPPQQCSTTSPLLSLSLTGHHRVHCISCLVRPPGWMISGPVGTRSGHRPSGPVASDSRALNLQIMLTINNAAPPPFCDRFDLVAPFTGRQCEPEPRLNAQDVGGGIKRALVSAAL